MAKNRTIGADSTGSTGLGGKYTGLPGKPHRPRPSGYRASGEILPGFGGRGAVASTTSSPPLKTTPNRPRLGAIGHPPVPTLNLTLRVFRSTILRHFRLMMGTI